jgi:hypothetical protein
MLTLMDEAERDRELFEQVLRVYRRFRDHAELGFEASAPLIAANLTASYFAAKTSGLCRDVDASMDDLINVVRRK